MSEVKSLSEQIEDARELTRYPSQVEGYHKLLVAAYESGRLGVIVNENFDVQDWYINGGKIR